MGEVDVLRNKALWRLEQKAVRIGGHASGFSPPKRRKVSAVRDWPKMCGPLAPKVDHRLTEPVVVTSGLDSRSAQCNGIKGESEAKVGSTIKEEIDNSGLLDNLGSDKENVATPLANGVDEVEVVIDVEDVGVGKPAALDSGEMEEPEKALELETGKMLKKSVKKIDVWKVSDEPENASLAGGLDQPTSSTMWSPPCWPVAASIVLKEIPKPKNYPPRKRVWAVRDFPPLCGRNAPNIVMKEHVKVLDTQMMGMGEESGLERKRSEEMGETGVRKVRDGESELQNNSKMKGYISEKNVDVMQASHNENASISLTEMESSFETEIDHEDLQEKNVGHPIDGSLHGMHHKSETATRKGDGHVGELGKKIETAIATHRKVKSVERKYSADNPVALEVPGEREIVLGLMASKFCPWRKGKEVVVDIKPSPRTIASGKKANKSSGRDKSVVGPLKRKDESESSVVIMAGQGKSSGKDNSIIGSLKRKYESESSGVNVAGQGSNQLVLMDDAYYSEHKVETDDFYVFPRSNHLDVCLPPAVSSNSGSIRKQVKAALRLFQAIFRKMLQGEEAKLKSQGGGFGRIDQKAAKILKEKGMYVNPGKPILGHVPGVEVGDEFHYRVELNIVGLHRANQAGIDCLKQGDKLVAASIVASGGYEDDLENADSLVYTGQGGNITGDKEPENQKLEKGNLALVTSYHEKNYVRVIRGFKEMKALDSESRAKAVMTYTYDGLYIVNRYWQELGPHKKLVYKFELLRIAGQPELTWKIAKVAKKSKKIEEREGLCAKDISQGKELIPMCAVNTIDDEKPPSFVYITRMMYPDWCHLIPPKGCDCTGGCSDSKNCLCAVKNGGEIPYNYSGAIVEAKPLVFECGPNCKCPPSCPNRVSQHGVKVQLEIFKTVSRGWGVRSLTSILSGTFICEYIGELLHDKEAEQRTGNDEYLFDIGNNCSDHALADQLMSIAPENHLSPEVLEDGGFTIDAAHYGNIGRFINHSCSPNLYAQNVVYDFDDNRIPHVMLFAADNIPPLHELTYDYNYKLDQVRDSDGNIKTKACYCGSADCTGRMY
ncbi:SRA-YDG [Dillenia turbinata]|uniref:SRA-YDG n=1 Tax=Dillenia turbinata TaxID=194707 RepID=A0AAN8WEY1_9MAGN